jgi:hypothetical protein
MMAPYVIVCAFDKPPPDDLAETLELADRLRLVRGEEHPDLWISWSRFHEVEAPLAAALTAGQVSSAALLATLPPPDERWILTQWRGQLAVHGSIAHQLDPRFWAGPSCYELIDLRVFAPSGEAPRMSMTEPPQGRGGRRAEWVETVSEYRTALETDRPVLITAPAQQIMTRMRDWFGELADERVGGAIAVLAMSGVTPSSRSQVVLRSPAALGLRRVTGATTLAALRKAGRITAQAWGTSSDNPAWGIDRPRPALRRRASRSLAAELTALKAATGARHGVLIELAEGADPEVLVDTGLVFEQETLNSVQNLAIAAGSMIALDVGHPVTRAMPAWCLNRRLAPPGGQVVRPTPLFVPLTANMDQGTVWNIMERSVNSFGTPA